VRFQRFNTRRQVLRAGRFRHGELLFQGCDSGIQILDVDAWRQLIHAGLNRGQLLLELFYLRGILRLRLAPAQDADQ
jgi:hypothetical protein